MPSGGIGDAIDISGGCCPGCTVSCTDTCDCPAGYVCSVDGECVPDVCDCCSPTVGNVGCATPGATYGCITDCNGCYNCVSCDINDFRACLGLTCEDAGFSSNACSRFDSDCDCDVDFTDLGQYIAGGCPDPS
jgi:hypothetical protein